VKKIKNFMSKINIGRIESLLGAEAQNLLAFANPKVAKEKLHLPGPNFVKEVFSISDRSKKVQSSLQKLFSHGRLAKTGYLSILPVDQGLEHVAGEEFAKNPDYFDPENIVKLAIEGGCNAVASSFGVLGMVSKKYAEKIPFIVKLNHNDLLRYPNDYDQVMFGSVQEAWDMGALGVGATIYFGSPESKRQISEIAEAFAEAHRLGMFTILWCYLRNPAFKVNGTDYTDAADMSAQADYVGANIEADIVKQKLPTKNGGYVVLNEGGVKYGLYNEKMYADLASDHPIDLCRYQVLNGFAGRVGLITSGGGSGEDDLREAVRTAVINKRAGGMGLIIGRKSFQKSLKEGIEILNAVQDVYLCQEVTVV
jgi:class I fructose-bisphosphate aldolase